MPDQLPPTLTIKGRRPAIHENQPHGWYVTTHRNASWGGYLWHTDADWHPIATDYGQGVGYWPTCDEARQFCVDHADKKPAETWTAEEQAAITDLAKRQELTEHQVLRQALRLYQAHVICPLCGQMTVHDPVDPPQGDARQAVLSDEACQQIHDVLNSPSKSTVVPKDIPDARQAGSYPDGGKLNEELAGLIGLRAKCDNLRHALSAMDPFVRAELLGRLLDDHEQLRQRLAEAERLIEIQRPATKTVGNLFCWCLENLQPWPPTEGEWVDDVKRRLKQLTSAQAEVAKLREERDAAMVAVGEWAGKCGDAEGKLKASELACVMEAWKHRAEQAEAERDLLRAKLERIRHTQPFLPGPSE